MALRSYHPHHPSLPWQGVEGAHVEARVMSEAISEAEAQIAALMSSATQTKQVRYIYISQTKQVRYIYIYIPDQAGKIYIYIPDQAG